jgi:hypothetical protein
LVKLITRATENKLTLKLVRLEAGLQALR